MSGYNIEVGGNGAKPLADSLKEAGNNADATFEKVSRLKRETEQLARIRQGSIRSEQIGAGLDPSGVKYATNLQQERADRSALDAHFRRMATGQTRLPAEVAPEKDPRPNRTANNGPRDRVFQWQQGSAQRQDRDIQFLRNAVASGDSKAIFDAEARLRRTSRAVQRDQELLDGPKPKSRQDLIWEALQTSRIGPAGQLMPLMNKLRAAGLSSPEELASQYGITTAQATKMGPAIAAAAKAALPLMGAVTATYGAYRLADAAAERMRMGSATYWQLGANPTVTGQALALGGPEVGGRAMQLGDRLRDGTYGAGYMRSRGINDLGPVTIDKGTNYVRAVRELRKIPSDAQAIRVARDLGLENELRFRDVSDTDMARLENSWGQTGSPAERRKEAKYSLEKDIASNSWNRAIRTVGAPFVTYFANQMQNISDWADAPLWQKPFYGLRAYAGANPFLNGLVSQRIGEPLSEEQRAKVGKNDFWLGNAFSSEWWQYHFFDERDPKKRQAQRQARKQSEEDIRTPRTVNGDPVIVPGKAPAFYGGGDRAANAVKNGVAWQSQAVGAKFDYDAVNMGAMGFH